MSLLFLGTISLFIIFKANFIGSSKIAREAEILNPEDLIFNEEKITGKYKLTANANKPLQIRNKITGYTITYDLIQFNHIVVGHNQIYSFYLGYPFFKDITSEEKLNHKKVEKKRKKNDEENVTARDDATFSYLQIQQHHWSCKKRERKPSIGFQKKYNNTFQKKQCSTI